MQTIHSRRLLGALLALVVSCTLALTATGADVYSVKFGFTGAAQDENNGAPVIDSVKATANNIINIARGRGPTAQVPDNEVLAAVLDCSAALSLVVFDTGTSSILATIAVPVENEAAGDSKKGVAVIRANIVASGSPSNSLNSGYLVFTAKVNLGVGGCPIKAACGMAGVINATTTDNIGSVTANVLVLKGKVTIGSKIGTIAP
jgi:hypothetical protein